MGELCVLTVTSSGRELLPSASGAPSHVPCTAALHSSWKIPFPCSGRQIIKAFFRHARRSLPTAPCASSTPKYTSISYLLRHLQLHPALWRRQGFLGSRIRLKPWPSHAQALEVWVGTFSVLAAELAGVGPDPISAHTCVMQSMSTKCRTITSAFLTPVEQAEPDCNSFHNSHMQMPLRAAGISIPLR